MKISIRFDGNRFVVHPDPAVVNLGDEVEWVCAGEGPSVQEWTLAFRSDRSPFSSPVFRQVTQTVMVPQSHGGFQSIAQMQAATIPAGAAFQLGDYKYGISIRDEESGDDLGELDPLLIVR